jgi:hypothetical protein
VKQVTSSALNYINHVKLKDHIHLCLPLELQRIIRAEVEDLPVVKTSKAKTTSSTNFTHSYTVLFEVAPSGGIFESRIFYDHATGQQEVNSDILRINLYGQTSACIQDKYELRSFCYCLSNHKTMTKNEVSTMAIVHAVNVSTIIRNK